MSDPSKFEILQSHAPGTEPDRSQTQARLDGRQVCTTLRDFKESSKYYQADKALIIAVNMAMAVGAPLLVTGEPGTGKTQVAHYLAWYFDIPLFEYTVRSTSEAEDIKYDFDAVRWLRNAQNPEIITDKNNGTQRELEKRDCLNLRALWHAYECETQCVLLIDEIDKAPRDFPNDLLQELDKHEFADPFDQTVKVTARNPAQPPIVVITSNAERRLPDAFLRRCIYHYIVLDDNLLRRAVTARAGDFPNLGSETRDIAIEKFLEIRGIQSLVKKPATGEILVWLSILSAQNKKVVDLKVDKLSDLPAIRALLKDEEDFNKL